MRRTERHKKTKQELKELKNTILEANNTMTEVNSKEMLTENRKTEKSKSIKTKADFQNQ